MKINILGTEYTFKNAEPHEDKNLKSCGGYCDTSTKELVVDLLKSSEGEPFAMKDLTVQAKKSTRHEIIHAFLYESGLAENSWAENEEIVDWIAVQFPKLLKAFNEADAI